MLLLQTLLISFATATAFTNARTKFPNRLIVPQSRNTVKFEHSGGEHASNRRTELAIFVTPALVALLTLSSPADAIEGPLSILAGRSASMLHPLSNLALFGNMVR